MRWQLRPKFCGSSDGVGKRFAERGAIILSFIVALEFAIMISPFAFFFYAVFNPFLLALNRSSLTRWLTAFFLPHMIVPPNGLLTVVRILGSTFFVLGMLIFIACAMQVYLGKLLKKGVATKGLYTIVRHPQYLGLGMAALGLAVMWPRFLTLPLLAIMLFLYYILAKDEERRMINRFGEDYLGYMNRTGMFLPHSVEQILTGSQRPRSLSLGKALAMLLVLLAVIVGGGFIVRAYTVHHLPLEQVDEVDVITITREDLTVATQLLPSVLRDPTIASKLKSVENDKDHRFLAYFIPIHYVMQGMIADTGREWKLFEHHKTIDMIAEYIFHPFAHLTTSGHSHHGMMEAHVHGSDMHNSPAMERRIIFIELSDAKGHLKSPFDNFAINAQRTPLFFVDVRLHTGEILQVKDTPSGSGWGTVPTPMF